MDKISKIGLAVCVILLIGWFYLQKKDADERGIKSIGDSESIPQVDEYSIKEDDSKVEEEIIEEEIIEEEIEERIEEKSLPSSGIVSIETDLLKVELNRSGGIIQKIILKENPKAGIRKLPDEESGSVILLSSEILKDSMGAFIDDSERKMNFEREKDRILFSGMIEDDVAIKKEYIFEEKSYLARLNISICNESDDRVWRSEPELVCGSMKPIDKDDSLEVDILSNEGIQRVKETAAYRIASIEWIGLKTKYFTAIVKPTTLKPLGYEVTGLKKDTGSSKAVIGCARGPVASPYLNLRATIKFADIKLSPGEEMKYSFLLFMGPANYDLLKKEGQGFAGIVDLGFLSPICKAIIWLLGNIYGIIGSYGWAIIFLTLIVKLILWPLTHKSYQSMKEMQKLQPKIAELKEKYKKDSKKIQAETMKLYKEHGVNPMGGCLPLIFQMPVLIALFTTLRNTILLRKASFWIIPGQWIQDLSGPDKLATLPNSYPIIGNQLNILPLMMGATFYLQQKFTPTSGAASSQSAQQQKMMATMMPIFFTFIFYSMPAGLNLYFMLSTIITVIQQYAAKGKK